MGYKFELSERTLIVSFEGDLDHHNASILREKVDKEIEKSSIKNLVFDFEKISFMDSSGIGFLLGRYKKVEIFDGSAYVVNLNSSMNRIFEMSGLFKIIKKSISIQNAVEEIKKGEK